MGRIYPVPFSGTLTAAGTDTDIFSFQAADDKPIRLRGLKLGQTSEVGDAAEENLRVTVKRITTSYAVGSGGSAVTAAAPMNSSGDTVWSFTARTNDTTPATGTAQVLDEIGWNERATPMETWYPDVDFCPASRQGEGLVIRLETTLADDMSFVGVAYVEELG